MRPLFSSLVGRGATPSFNLGDLVVGAPAVTMGGTVPGVLCRVCLRCVLGLLLRTRGIVELVLVVTIVAGGPTPSVAAFSPSEVGNVPPFIHRTKIIGAELCEEITHHFPTSTFTPMNPPF